MLQDIQLELLTLASAIQLNIEGHMYKASAESLAKSESFWACPTGQIQERGLCSMYFIFPSFKALIVKINLNILYWLYCSIAFTFLETDYFFN